MPGSQLTPFLALLLLGCGTEVRPGTDPGLEARRVSMALRGVPPTAGEVARVRADAAALDGLTEVWLADPAFAETVADWHAEMLWLRHDTQTPLPAAGPLAGVDRGAIGASLAEAPLRRVASLVREGRPYTELFAGRTVAVDAIGAEVWGLPWDSEVGGWQLAEWSDDRPAAGILVDSNLWMRHGSSDTNHQRGRANLVHRVWLCEDLSARTLELGDLDLTDVDAVADAVRQQPDCAGCHQTLDPLASAFAGWHKYVLPSEVREAHAAGCPDGSDCYPIHLWRPDRAPTRQAMDLPDPALAGTAVTDLGGVADALVTDPRFAPCVARQMAAYLGQEDLGQVPSAEVDALAEVFVESGADLRALARAIVRSDRFAAQGGEVGPLVARPEQVARSLEAVSGFRWWGDPDGIACEDGCWGEVDLGRNARWGYREIAGGMDGYDSLHPVHAPQPLRHLAVARMAEEAAGQVVVAEAGRTADERRLLRELESLQETRPEPVQRQIAALHERLLGEVPSSTDIARAYGLWEGAHAAGGSTERAWALLIAAMLQSPERVLY